MALKFRVIPKACNECGVCYKVCLDISQAIAEGPPYVIDPVLCTTCKECYNQCPVQAIEEYEWEPEPPNPPAPEPAGPTLTLGLTLKDS